MGACWGTDGTVLFGRGVQRDDDPNNGSGGAGLLQIVGPAAAHPLPATQTPIVGDAAFGARTIRVASTESFEEGDAVVVRRLGNEAWHAELRIDFHDAGNDGTTGEKRHDAERTIVGIDRGAGVLTLDVGVPIAVEERWGGGVVFKYEERRIAQVAVQNLRGTSQPQCLSTCSLRFTPRT